MSSEEFALLKELIINPLKKAGAQVWVFGSRARGDHKRTSDIDILYDFGQDLTPPSGLIFSIKDDFDESRFPYTLDLVALKDLAASYREQVLNERKIV